MLAGMCIQAGLTLITVKLMIIGLFLFITGPTSTHAVANAALVSGLRPKSLATHPNSAEIESEKYNLSLNKDKCFYIGMNGTANIHFKDGTKIKKTDCMTYLGGTITEDSSRNAEISSRMFKALASCQKLKLL